MRRPERSTVLVLAGATLATLALVTALRPADGTSAAVRAAEPVAATPARVIEAEQQRLRRVPGDHTAWARLGSAYVQQARVTGDPAFNPRAEEALSRSLRLRPGNAPALTGLGALAAARHDFAAARDHARAAIAANPYGAAGYGVLDDALTQLGDETGARAATEKMLRLEPGVASFARASYHLELAGDVAGARSAMQRALADADDPADVAFCRFQLGELAFGAGDPAAADEQYRLGLAARPGDDRLTAGRARALAALGRSEEALRLYAAAAAAVPQPQYLLEHGELLQSLGRQQEAAERYALLTAQRRVLAAGGVRDDLAAAEFEADHGSPAAAVTHARAEYARRTHVQVADALAWSLHRAGRSAEALPYAREANRLGYRSARLRYHLGAIEAALGMRAEARRDLSSALALNPSFSPLHAPQARKLLAGLGAA